MPDDGGPVILMAEAGLMDGLIFEGIDPNDASEPHFSVSEVAKTFFKRSSHWVRWRESKGHFVFDGKTVEPLRTDGGSRLYRLPDIEAMAHGLAQQELISGEELTNTIRVIYAVAKLWGFVEDE